MPKGPAARIADPVVHPLPPVLGPGPGSVNVLIGGKPAWRGVPAGAAAAIQSAKATSDATIKTAEAATMAAAGTPGAPAAKAAEEATKAAAAASMGSMISGAAGGADIHVCGTPLPIPPHGPGVVIDGSATVLINGLPACRMGDTIIEAVGPPNKVAMGCPTVIIGDGGGGGGGGAQGVAGAAVGGPSTMTARQAANKELVASGRINADAAKVGVSPARLAAMREGKCPLAFQSPAQYQQFQAELRSALSKAGLGDAAVRMKGTSTTFYSENPKKPQGHHFDADPSAPADVDLGIESQSLAARMRAARVAPSDNQPELFRTRDVVKQYPELAEFGQRWSKTLGRDVNFVGRVNPTVVDAAPTDFVTRGTGR